MAILRKQKITVSVYAVLPFPASIRGTSIATVDFVHFQSGEQQFFTDHEKLESFRSDLVVAEAMERLYQQLNQPDIGIRMGEM